MKRLFTILTTLALLCAVGCEEQGDDNVNPNDKPNTEQPGEKPDDGSEIPDDAYISINKEVLTFSPDGESVDIKVYSNYEWTLTNNCDWVTTSISSGEASDAGVVVTLTADLTYDDREGTIKFSCGRANKLLVVSQSFKQAIIADENNVFNVPAEGSNVIINYQTTVECEVIIPEEAKSWISLAPATRALVSESATLTVAENTTYSERSAVVKVVKVGDNTLFAEYTINQVQNDAIIADENNILDVPAEGGVVEVAYQTNVECKVVIPEEAKSWISLTPATRALVSESATLTVAENTTYSERSAVIKVVAVDNEDLVVEYTINQVQNDAIIADENNIFNIPVEGGVVEVAYQTNVECEVIIPEEAKSWISLAPATRALVKESETLTIAENTTYSARSAVIKVVKVGDNTLFAEYTIHQVQNDAIIADENNTFNLKGWAQSINIAYKTNVECEVVIPEESQSWISFAPATRALVSKSATLNIAENNTGAERSTVVKVVATNNNELVAEYTITQNQRYYIEYTSSDGSVVTPYRSNEFGTGILRNEYIDGKGYIDFDAPITSIGRDAFKGCSSLTSITIPDSVTSIGDYAFEDCTSLTSITIPDSVTEIGNYAFSSCSSLTSVTIPDSVTEIGGSAFRGCSSLTSITIPDSVTSIGSSAFYYCTSLTNFYSRFASEDGRCLIIDGVLNSFAPAGLTEYTIPDSVTSIGNYAFDYCSSLTSITIPDSVTSIGDGAFYGCSSLASITIPDSVTSIGYRAFYDCTGELIINSKIVETNYTSDSYPYNTGWLDCAKFSKLTIGNGVTKIGNYAFYGCSSPTSITIPDSVTSIGDGAFYGCTGELIINSKIVETNYTYDSCPYETWLCGAEFSKLTIGNGVTSIGAYAFRGCSSLASITIPDSVTSIGEDAFFRCDSLTSITIPDSVTSIGGYAFYGCTSLTSITIPDSVTSIGDSAFGYCMSLTSITIPDSVTSIGEAAFRGCYFAISEFVNNSSINSEKNNYWGALMYEIIQEDGLCINGTIAVDCKPDATSVTFPDSVTSIGNGAFENCRSLTSITIGNGVTSIGDHAFYDCSSLTSITIPDSVTSIGISAFNDCSSLTSITIPDSVTSIGDRAFFHCDSLTSITIPDSVTSLGGYAFYGCTSLTSITIPDSVTSIGYRAFYNCSSLTSVTIGNGVTSIGDSAFYECYSLISITIGNGVTSIGKEAFYECSSLTSVYCKAVTPPAGGSSMFSFNASGRKIYVPRASVNAYKFASYWSVYANNIVGYDFE